MPDIFDSSQLSAPIANPSTTPVSVPESEPELLQDGQDQALLSDPTPETPQLRKDAAIAQLMENIGDSSNPFGAFSMQPRKVCLDIQMQDEEVLLLMRQHPITQLRWVFIAVLLIFVPILFSYVNFFTFLPPRFATVVGLGWFLTIISFVLSSFLRWFYNIYVITNERIIDIDFNSLLSKNISTAKLNRIEDITVTNLGYLGSVFDYGTVVIQTAGAVDQFDFNETPHPNRVSAFLNDLLNEQEQFERHDDKHAGPH